MIALLVIFVAQAPSNWTHELVQPMKRPDCAFMRQLNITHGPDYATELIMQRGGSILHPSWTYLSGLPAPKLAQKLKILLKNNDGWALTFPSLAEPYCALARHETKGKSDLRLDVNWKKPDAHPLITITDESKTWSYRP